MPTTFQWAGRTPKGIIQKGELIANSKEEVMAYLKRQNIVPTNVAPKPKALLKLPFGAKVTDKDIVVFTRQFSTMIDAGLPLVQALDILSKQTENKALARAIGEIKGDVEGGATFANALKKHPKMFSDLYVNMVAAGETGGILDTILNRLAQYIEKAMKLKRQVKGAMIYPSVIMTVAALAVAVILIFVIPVFAQMFTQLGGILPLPTRIVVGLSNFLKAWWWLILAGIIGGVILINQARKTDRGKRIIDTALLKAPIFGVLIRKVAIARFTRTLGTLVSSGVPILDGLEITAKTSGNKVVETAIFEVRKAVSQGKTIAEPLAKSKVFPPMVTQMIAVGESTGALDAMLGKIADFYDDEVDTAVANLTSMIEPVLIVFVGITIGFIVVAMYLPIFKLFTLIN